MKRERGGLNMRVSIAPHGYNMKLFVYVCMYVPYTYVLNVNKESCLPTKRTFEPLGVSSICGCCDFWQAPRLLCYPWRHTRQMQNIGREMKGR